MCQRKQKNWSQDPTKSNKIQSIKERKGDKTTDNIEKTGAFTIGVADLEQLFWSDADADHYLQILEYGAWHKFKRGAAGCRGHAGYAGFRQ